MSLNLKINRKLKFDGTTLLHNRLNLNTVPNTYSCQYYIQIYSKLVNILEVVYSNYPIDGYIFVPVESRLGDIYDQLRHILVWFEDTPLIEDLNLNNLTGFALEGDFRFHIRLWANIQKTCKDDISLLIKNYQIRYQTPPDLLLVFKEVDELLKEHIIKKNNVLRTQKLLPDNELLSFGKKNSIIKLVYNELLNAKGEWVRVRHLANNLNKTDAYIRIEMGELKRKIRSVRKENQLKIESSGKGSYRLLIS